MENLLQVSCSPSEAKFLKAFSHFKSLKYLKTQSAWGRVCKRASECWKQMQLDVLTLEMWWGNSCRRSIRKDCPERTGNKLRLFFKRPVIAGVIVLHENDKHPVWAALWSGCASAAPGCEELQEGTSLWVLQEMFYVIFPFTPLQRADSWISDTERNRFLPLLRLSVIPDHPAGHSSIACVEQTAVC